MTSRTRWVMGRALTALAVPVTALGVCAPPSRTSPLALQLEISGPAVV
ncbi:hypothetical protein [Streptomyces sp. CA-106110]